MEPRYGNRSVRHRNSAGAGTVLVWRWCGYGACCGAEDGAGAGACCGASGTACDRSIQCAGGGAVLVPVVVPVAQPVIGQFNVPVLVRLWLL